MLQSLVVEESGKRVRRKSSCTFSIQNPPPPSKGITPHLKNYSKSTLVLSPKQPALNKFYSLTIPANRFKIVPYSKSKAGIQETTVKEMKHDVNI